MGRRGGGGGGGGGVSLSVNVDSPAVVFAVLHGITLLVYVVMMLAEPSFVFAFLMLFGARKSGNFALIWET